MMRGIVDWSLRFRFLVLGLAVALMFFGVGQVRACRSTSSRSSRRRGSRSRPRRWACRATEIEELVTDPLEQALQGDPGLDVMRSKSVPDLSSILLIFEPGTDLSSRASSSRSASRRHADAADLGGATVHDAAAVGDEPRHEDRVSSDTRRLIDLSMLAAGRSVAAAGCPAWRTSRSGASEEQLHVQVDPSGWPARRHPRRR